MSSPTRRLEGKVALITGGASGIGECAAKLFAEHGAKIVIVDVQDQLGQVVCESIGSSNSIYVHCDVTNEEHVKNAVDTAVETYGKLDIMFCNAGIVDPNKQRIIDNEKSDFKRVLSINVTGVFLSMKHAARVMVPARSGSIISTASISSNIGGAASHAYCCAKHAVAGLTKNLAVELGQFGIRVNCLSPYCMVTPLATSFVGVGGEALENVMNQLSNLKGVTLRTDDVAKAALFLVSDEAKYISGQNLFIDGGFSIVNPSFNMFKYPENWQPTIMLSYYDGRFMLKSTFRACECGDRGWVRWVPEMALPGAKEELSPSTPSHSLRKNYSPMDPRQPFFPHTPANPLTQAPFGFPSTPVFDFHLKPMAATSRRLEGKVALITGAASGIGECSAKLFAEHGAKVVIADIQDQLGQAVCEAIGSSNSIYVHCDVTVEEDVKNAVDIAVATFGKLDIMFNNAWIMDPYKERVIDNEKSDFERVLSVNVTGVFLGMKHAARVMVPTRSGSIISMASVSANIAGVTTHAYTCAKHAVNGLTKNLAVELGQFGIRVNCLAPYAIATPMATRFLGLDRESVENKANLNANLKGVTLKTDDVAKAALFLASDEAKYISGQSLCIDGGFGIVNPSFNMFQYPENI
ncbi:hypothetical protein M8C21_016115 [Ambrosia artemisiifolia]|uniref:Glucose/ribitol dehydrogenase n=1 Tax=Ambrosia artemisiifolia TaxID=4212 RepID=A0AAD5CHA1_AMBAR|nr:hypothetical protein M8C21_016115 [Ambrosia artemisiifolia]